MPLTSGEHYHYLEGCATVNEEFHTHIDIVETLSMKKVIESFFRYNL
ncbi:hypothetical protein [Paenibacillus donghaensis]|nr:hypothetical protein [Paenibacillus donghaensis]